MYNGLTDNHEHLHGNSVQHLRCVPQLQIFNFKNQHGGLRHFEKSPYLGHSFSDFNEISALVAVWSVTNLKFKKSKMAAADILKN